MKRRPGLGWAGWPLLGLALVGWWADDDSGRIVWGNAGEWFAGIFTAGALSFAAYQFWKLPEKELQVRKAQLQVDSLAELEDLLSSDLEEAEDEMWISLSSLLLYVRAAAVAQDSRGAPGSTDFIEGQIASMRPVLKAVEQRIFAGARRADICARRSGVRGWEVWERYTTARQVLLRHYMVTRAHSLRAVFPDIADLLPEDADIDAASEELKAARQAVLDRIDGHPLPTRATTRPGDGRGR